MTIFEKLAMPFQNIHWRAQSLNRDGTSAMALAYIDARDVMERLDAVIGPENWRDRYVETPKGRLLCTLEIRIGDEWIGKSDGAGDTDVEGDKGAISDSLKRAAVKWGIGRYLYDMPPVWAECESYDANGKKRWSKWTAAGLRNLQKMSPASSEAVADAAPPAPTDKITDATRDWISAQIDKRQIIVGDLCAAFGVNSLKQLTYDRLDEIKAWIRGFEQREAA